VRRQQNKFELGAAQQAAGTLGSVWPGLWLQKFGAEPW
jgi:hypothetical protein